MLSDHGQAAPAARPRLPSQCTFWCSVLSDLALVPQHSVGEAVSMHLLVLSAFRLGKGRHRTQRVGLSQCTFWCSVLSDGPKMFIRDCGVFPSLNAPFGAQCFPTRRRSCFSLGLFRVSMHLLVLSAFRHCHDGRVAYGLLVSMHLLVLSAFRLDQEKIETIPQLESLNAPFGAQCFPTKSCMTALEATCAVSMHLLVLSAFRRNKKWNSLT